MSYFIKPNGIEAAVKPDDIAYFGKNCEALYYEMDGIIEIYKGGKYLGDIVCQPEDWGLILNGVNPIEDGWEDGCGNTLSYDGWGECAMNESRFSSKRNRKPLKESRKSSLIHRKPLKESRKFSVSKRSRRLNEFNFASDYDEDLERNPGLLRDLYKDYIKDTLDNRLPAEEGGILFDEDDYFSCKIYLSRIKNACELFMKKYLPNRYANLAYTEKEDYITVSLDNIDPPEMDVDFNDYQEDDESYPVYGEAYGWDKLSDYLEIEDRYPLSHPLFDCLDNTWIKIEGAVNGEAVKNDMNLSFHAGDFMDKKGNSYDLSLLNLNADYAAVEIDN